VGKLKEKLGRTRLGREDIKWILWKRDERARTGFVRLTIHNVVSFYEHNNEISLLIK
jgi:hypothetical protein